VVVLPDNVLFEGGAGQTVRKEAFENRRPANNTVFAHWHFLDAGCESKCLVFRQQTCLQGFEDLPLLHIFVDADACPVKHEVYRVASRYGLDVTLVANAWMRIPNETWLDLQVVEDGLDAADDWIVAQVQPHDIVITADIPLANRCLKKGARVVGATGKPFTENNIGQAVASRDLLSELRSAGEITGGPPPLTRRDRSRFLQQVDEMIQSIRREHPRDSP